MINQRAFSLEPLTLPDVHAVELINIAALTGYSSVGLVLHSPAPSLPVDPVVTDAQARASALDALRRTGVRLLNIECFNLTPDLTPAACEAALVCGHALGAGAASAIVWENGDRADVLGKLRRLCDMARELGIRVNLEFMALSRTLSSLQAAAELARDCDRENIGIMVDLLHLMRTGGTLADLRALDGELLGGAQICDGPLQVDSEAMLAEAGGNRATPGTAAFPIAGFIDLLPAHLTIGVEVPQVALIGRVSPLERARSLMEATRRVIDSTSRADVK